MKEDNHITDAIKVDVTNTEDNAKGEQTTGETAAAAEPTAAAAEPGSRQTDSANKDSDRTRNGGRRRRQGTIAAHNHTTASHRRRTAADEERDAGKDSRWRNAQHAVPETADMGDSVNNAVHHRLYLEPIQVSAEPHQDRQSASELEDAKYRALSSSSDLTQQTRESKVLERLHNDKGDYAAHTYAATVYNNHS